MPTLRVTPMLQALAAPRYHLLRAPIVLSPQHQRRRYAHGGSSYGGGEGDPKGENPQEQGSNPSAELEHPGPPPPSVGQGTGGGPTKAGESGHNDQENASSGSGDKSTSEQKNVSGSQPKILGENDPEHSEEVKAHNEDMKKRHDRPQEGVEPDAKDNVDKGFWSGKHHNLFMVRLTADICAQVEVEQTGIHRTSLAGFERSVCMASSQVVQQGSMTI